MTIIGITGTIGAGKGTIVEYLVQHHHYCHFSVRGYLTRLINEQNLPLNRDSMVQVANGLRAQHSPSYIIEELLREAKASQKNCIIESIRTVGEITALREQPASFFLFAVDAMASLRYKRVVERASETDNISFETFLENESREMTSTDPNKQNLAACQQLADFKFSNNGTFQDLYEQVENVLFSINAQ
ncbi:MAG: AAA family ATPase [Chitinophagales bacterium]